MGIPKKFTLPVAAALLSVSSLGLSGCSSEPSYCDEVSATQTSFDALVSTDILAEGTDALTQRFQDFSTQVETLLDSARVEFSDETAAVEESLQQVGAVVDEAANLNLGAAAQQAGPALESLRTSTQALLDAVQVEC
jgi:hypothetical protein